MGRNLYILAATLGALALVSIVLSFTNVAQQPGSPGDASLWRMTSIALFSVALIVTLLGILSSLFEQTERRHAIGRQDARQEKRRNRRSE
jgi:membrane protein DedA with SNARE-associated domain